MVQIFTPAIFSFRHHLGTKSKIASLCLFAPDLRLIMLWKDTRDCATSVCGTSNRAWNHGLALFCMIRWAEAVCSRKPLQVRSAIRVRKMKLHRVVRKAELQGRCHDSSVGWKKSPLVLCFKLLFNHFNNYPRNLFLFPFVDLFLSSLSTLLSLLPVSSVIIFALSSPHPLSSLAPCVRKSEWFRGEN